MPQRRRCALASCIAVVAITAAYASQCTALPQIQEYIKQSWTTLQRSNSTLDTKIDQSAGVEVYVPPGEVPWKIAAGFHNPGIRVETLPGDPASIKQPGLLYLPYPYVVPGGRFNEMYGWDSYFILLGLIRDGELKAAKDLTGDFLYEVEHYGKVLNANRTYYLSRSQPPFLTRMILEVYSRTGDLAWLRATVPAIENTMPTGHVNRITHPRRDWRATTGARTRPLLKSYMANAILTARATTIAFGSITARIPIRATTILRPTG